MPNANTATSSPSPGVPAATPRGVATCGWVVEVVMAEWSHDRRFFAVGTEHAADAEAFVLLHPGILHSDQRVARRYLSPMELSDLKLRTGAVRAYGWMLQASHRP